MANPFTAFAFPATGSNQVNRTMPARIAEIFNVKDYGAKGDGVTDDWAAIQSIINSFPTNLSSYEIGIIFFPPGTYLVSRSIDFTAPSGLVVNVSVQFTGVLGQSTITGNFADFILKHGILNTTGAAGGPILIEKLNITNSNSAGGGVKVGNALGVLIRDLIVSAQQGIWSTNDTNGNAESYATSILNCQVSPPSALLSGSTGIALYADGLIAGCSIKNCVQGIASFGGEGAQVIAGNHFEGNSTGWIAAHPDGTAAAANQCSAIGNHFKNNSVAINATNFTRADIAGNYIEAGAGTNGIIGIPGNSSVWGNIVTGTYSDAGIKIDASTTASGGYGNQFSDYRSNNSVSWTYTGNGSGNIPLINCNKAPVTPVADIPVFNATVTGTPTWSGGVVSMTLSGAPSLTTDQASWYLVVSGVTPSGYNGTFTATGTGATTLTYPLASNPGSYVSGGTVTLIDINNGSPAVSEGDCFNVSDGTNSLAWGAILTNSGSHTTRYKARFNGSNLTVVGQ